MTVTVVIIVGVVAIVAVVIIVRAVAIVTAVVILFDVNTCRASHFKMSPQRFTVEAIQRSSLLPSKPSAF